MDLKQIINDIQFGDIDNDDLNQIIEAVKWRRASLARHTVWTLKKGDRVSFTSNRNGRTYVGPVVEVLRKNVVVETQQGRFRVPASMLKMETA